MRSPASKVKLILKGTQWSSQKILLSLALTASQGKMEAAQKKLILTNSIPSGKKAKSYSSMATSFCHLSCRQIALDPNGTWAIEPSTQTVLELPSYNLPSASA